MDLGLEAAGFETRVAVELDADAAATLRTNRPQWRCLEGDIHAETASSRHLLERAELRAGEADLLVGGPPCQPFSKSGYWRDGDARRLDDPRSSTLAEYLRVLRDIQPRAFLIENVPGLAYSKKDEGIVMLERGIEEINRETGANYSFEAALLRAVDFGVPQDRQRLFIVGARDGTTFEFPAPTHGMNACDSGQGVCRFRTTWDAIGDLEEDADPDLAARGKWAALLPSIPEGKNYLYHTDRGGGLPLFGWRRRYWNFLLKLSKSLPSWTLTAQPGPAIGPFHWKNRRLSVQEMMRLQTFPDGYRISGSYRAATRQIGNAVPSALVEKLGLEIRRQLLGVPKPGGSQLSLIPASRPDAPPPEPVAPVPVEYLGLSGVHSSHPGTGLGRGALARKNGPAGVSGKPSANNLFHQKAS